MHGFYENFPNGVHHAETFTSPLSKRKLQKRIIQVLQDVNHKTFSFEEVGNPTLPNCSVIFEFGIADGENFRYLDEVEARKLQEALSHEEPLQVMDWFCSIRYYKNATAKQTPLRFDYYMLRINFGEKGAAEFLVFHERGPRYISPEELVTFIGRETNQTPRKKILK
jgi:hypothetical protein